MICFRGLWVQSLDTLLKEVKRDFISEENILKLGLQWMLLALWRWNLPRRLSNNTICSRLLSLEWKSDRTIKERFCHFYHFVTTERNERGWPKLRGEWAIKNWYRIYSSSILLNQHNEDIFLQVWYHNNNKYWLRKSPLS